MQNDDTENLRSSDCSSGLSSRKTVAVCRRWLPIGEYDTSCMIVDEKTTVGQINSWCDKLCHGNAVCIRLELVDQYRGS